MNIAIVKQKNNAIYWSMPLFFSVLVCLASQLRIFLPFSPVPFTLQVHLILLFAYLLGAKRALVMTGSFLLQGFLGFPIFAAGSGVSVLFGPTGGYLVGYLVASYVTGLLNQRSALLAMGLGNIVVYVFGWMHLSQFVGVTQALLLGIIPFLFFDALKLWLLCNSSCQRRTAFIKSSYKTKIY